MLRLNKWSLLILVIPILFLLLDFNYYSNLFEDFFSIDDAILVQIPQMQGSFNFSLIKSLFTLGNHIDYYPVRDMSYWFDINILGGSESNTFAFKIMNLFYFYILSVFLFFIFYELTHQTFVSLLSTLVWSVNPFHNEMLFWVSARKDLLFLTFFTISIFAFIKDYRLSRRTQKYFIFGVVFFILAGFTKAAGALAALAWPLYYFMTKETVKYVKMKSGILILLSLFFVILNKINYANNNVMYFQYTLEYRGLAALAALGRSVAGYFWAFYNGLDTENWGEWGELNRQFILPGFLALVGTCGIFFLLLKRHQRFLFFFVLLILVLSSVPGINPLHRNFYSVRYYELPFLILYVSLIIYFFNDKASSHKKRIIFLVFLFIVFLISHKVESPNWKGNLSLAEKSLKITPSNPALMKNYLVEYEMIKRWGKQSPEDDEKASRVADAVLDICSKNFHWSQVRVNGELCLNLWSFPDGFPSFPKLNRITARAKDSSEYAINEFARLSRLPKDRIDLHFLSAKDVLDSAENKKAIFMQYIVSNMSTENRRILYLAVLCQNQEAEKLNEAVSQFSSMYLISKSGIIKFLSSLSSDSYKDVKLCLLDIRKRI